MNSISAVFDPRTWPAEPALDEPRYLSLSARIDCHACLDYQDWLWARHLLWCHTYGSGSFTEEGVIQRPDNIYARRSIPLDGTTPSGRPRYGSEFLHREILWRSLGPPPFPDMVGDHINGDTLDNRRVNLRWATKLDNIRNRVGTAERERLARTVPIPARDPLAVRMGLNQLGLAQGVPPQI